MAVLAAATAEDKAAKDKAVEDAATKSREDGEISSSIKEVEEQSTSKPDEVPTEGTREKPIDADAATAPES